MSDLAVDAATVIGCAACGAGLFVLGWIVGHLDRDREYWRGRREGYDRCEAGWQRSLADARERAQAVDAAWARAERRAAVLGRVARGGLVNEGNVIAVLKDGQWQAWDGQPEGEGK